MGKKKTKSNFSKNLIYNDLLYLLLLIKQTAIILKEHNCKSVSNHLNLTTNTT